ncbi:MAG: gamma-glutamylcyclotransferase [Chloroflexi bacterium]|nr:gamma-glutamylcyclotransferase [Chloroflexota bacterium]
MLAFAYGSNMDWRQARLRCPSARFVCIAKLKDYCLVFPRKNKNGHGVAGIQHETGSDVWGVVYEIADIDIGNLDRSEGYQPGRNRNSNSYVREERHVYADGDESKPISAWLYLAVPQQDPPLPNTEYKRLITEGAKFWHLPLDYINQLEQIKTSDRPLELSET